MLVSVVVPVHNNEKYLHRVFECLTAQTYRNLQIVLVENGSKDSSLKLCEEYADKDSRVEVYKIEKNAGAGMARNLGIQQARGEYICFLDADDWYESTLIQKLVESVSENNADVVICGYDTYVEGAENNGEKISFASQTFNSQRESRTFFADTFPHGITGFLWNKIYKLSVIRENNILFPGTERLEDGFFNLKFFSVARSCNVVSDVLYHYRLSASSEVIKKHSEQYHCLVELLVENTLEEIAKWEDVGDVSYTELYRFYLNEIGTCIENAFVGDWGFSAKNRKEYLDLLTDNDTYRLAINHLGVVGAYRRVLHKLLNGKHYVLLGVVVRVKTFVKKNFKKIYYLLKK